MGILKSQTVKHLHNTATVLADLYFSTKIYLHVDSKKEKEGNVNTMFYVASEN